MCSRHRRLRLTQLQRDEAWEVFPYPCVGEFGFLDFNLCHRPSYAKTVARLTSDASARHLDVGCCVGQDIRKLVLDGCPSERITGLELEPGFIDLGYALFKDQEKLQTMFLKANILTDTALVQDFEGKMSSIHMGMVFHLFDREEQKKVLAHLLAMLVDDGTGILLGHCIAHTDGVMQPAMLGKMTMRHNLETWKALCDEVRTETGYKFTTWEELMMISMETRYATWRDDGKRILAFEVRRLG
jgi:SAM-dependent methyltransferase